MKIAVDIVSGDKAPEVLLEGVVEALREVEDFSVIIIGDKNATRKYLESHQDIHHRIDIHHCTDVIGMNEKPVEACKTKPSASVMIASKLVAESQADGFFSPGNTGAIMIASFLHIKCIEGITRPAITITFPKVDGMYLLLDCGANIDMKAQQFLELAVIGQAYGSFLLNIPRPSMGLLNIGTEENKGNILYQRAFQLLQKTHMNFVGNIEPHDLLNGAVDVALCDGFVGNITLKLFESLLPNLIRIMESREHNNTEMQKLTQLFNTRMQLFNPVHYGGAPLLGLNGYVMVGHGNSGAVATKNALFAIRNMIRSNVQQRIKNTIHALQCTSVP